MLTLTVYDSQQRVIGTHNPVDQTAAEQLLQTTYPQFGSAASAGFMDIYEPIPGHPEISVQASRRIASYTNTKSGWSKDGQLLGGGTTGGTPTAKSSILPLVLGASALGLILYFVFRKKG